MEFKESAAVNNVIKAACTEAFNEDLDCEQMEAAVGKFFELIDAAVFNDGENELDFEAGFELALKYKSEYEKYATQILLYKQNKEEPQVFKFSHNDQTYYCVGTETEVVDRINTIFNCWCPNQTLIRSGCQCGGN